MFCVRRQLPANCVAHAIIFPPVTGAMYHHGRFHHLDVSYLRHAFWHDKRYTNDEPQARMVCLPAFASTGQAAVLDLDTLECTPLRFSSAFGIVDETSVAKDVKSEAPADKEASSAMEVEAAAAD